MRSRWTLIAGGSTGSPHTVCVSWPRVPAPPSLILRAACRSQLSRSSRSPRGARSPPPASPSARPTLSLASVPGPPALRSPFTSGELFCSSGSCLEVDLPKDLPEGAELVIRLHFETGPEASALQASDPAARNPLLPPPSTHTHASTPSLLSPTVAGPEPDSGRAAPLPLHPVPGNPCQVLCALPRLPQCQGHLPSCRAGAAAAGGSHECRAHQGRPCQQQRRRLPGPGRILHASIRRGSVCTRGAAGAGSRRQDLFVRAKGGCSFWF